VVTDHKLDFTSQNAYAGLAHELHQYAWGAFPIPTWATRRRDRAGVCLRQKLNLTSAWYSTTASLICAAPISSDLFRRRPRRQIHGERPDQPFMPVKRCNTLACRWPSRTTTVPSNGQPFIIAANDGNLPQRWSWSRTSSRRRRNAST
jgi:hypothetical protein